LEDIWLSRTRSENGLSHGSNDRNASNERDPTGDRCPEDGGSNRANEDAGEVEDDPRNYGFLSGMKTPTIADFLCLCEVKVCRERQEHVKGKRDERR
jgi:hypothetical protein